MRTVLLSLTVASLASFGCVGTTSYVDTQAQLGRVVIYRNGIAYFERTAEVEGNEFELAVPADKVDDFLKSLTVLDATTKQPTPIAYPTRPPISDTGLISMKIQLKDMAADGGPRKLLLSYVTEAPSWKPSYRIVLGKGGKVDLEAWAIVDNTSGEDWNNVKLGVGSSSALSFRFDLHSVRTVARETLAPSDMFAQAPPTGMSVYSNGQGVLEYVDDATLASVDRDGDERMAGRAGSAEETVVTFGARGPSGGLKGNDRPPPPAPEGKSSFKRRVLDNEDSKRETKHAESSGDGYDARKKPALDPGPSSAEFRMRTLAQRVKNDADQRYVIEGFAGKGDADKNAAALGRANKLRNELIEKGVRPEQIDAVANTTVVAETGGARVLEAGMKIKPQAEQQKADENEGLLEPIGTSHFESKAPMSVARGTSAMVSILHTETVGEVVYLYDAESQRGNATHAFKSVRLENPTESALETGPVTVFGDGGFIGEGLTEPIPGKSASFVPFALDRQIVVETKNDESEGIARILTAQRGVLTTEMRHTKKQKLVLHNRLEEAATVYVRHTVPKGYTLSKHPEHVERIGQAHLFRLEVPAKGQLEVAIEEETPVFKTVDIRSPAGMEQVRLFVSSAALESDAGSKLKGLLELQKELGNVEQKIDSQREQMGEYRTRMDELHAQVVTLKAVKTGGSLMKNLEKKLEEVSDRLSRSTVDLVALEEQRMIARIKLQDGVSELSLDRAADKKSSGKVAEK